MSHIFKFFRKRKKAVCINEIDVREQTQSTDDEHKDWKTLGDLANSGHSFLRFSQSQPEISFEKVYAEYIPGKITEAKDDEKLLSFVTEETIATCFMYGDTLTSLKFDLDDEEFKKIADTPFKCIGNPLGEYESKYLLVENNYSLEDVNTIVKLFDYVISTQQLISIFYSQSGSLDEWLHDLEFYESEKLVKYLKGAFNKNVHITPEEIRDLIKQYLNVQ